MSEAVAARQRCAATADADPPDQPGEDEQADEDVEQIGGGIELAHQTGQRRLVAAHLEDVRILELGQIGEEQGDEQDAVHGKRERRQSRHGCFTAAALARRYPGRSFLRPISCAADLR